MAADDAERAVVRMRNPPVAGHPAASGRRTPIVMGQSARGLHWDERRASSAALPHRGPNDLRSRPEIDVPSGGNAKRCPALFAAFRAQHDPVARRNSAQQANRDLATSADLSFLRTPARRKCGHPGRPTAKLDGGMAHHMPDLRHTPRGVPAVYAAYSRWPSRPSAGAEWMQRP